MEKEPVITDWIKKQMQEARKKAEELGHSFEEWRWDGHNCWRIWCQMRNYHTHLWVNSNGEVGGNALNIIDWMKQFKMSIKQ